MAPLPGFTKNEVLVIRQRRSGNLEYYIEGYCLECDTKIGASSPRSEIDAADRFTAAVNEHALIEVHFPPRSRRKRLVK